MWRSDELDSIPIHFILCTERTGSSLLATMLNMNSSLIVASEEPFALYFSGKYGKISDWNESRIKAYVHDFFSLFEKNAALFFEHKERFTQCLINHASILNYDRLIKLTYLNFYDCDIKNKDSIKVILDKQMKYVFHKEEITRSFPNATFLILTRDVLNNIEAKARRGIDFFSHPYYLSNVWKLTYDEALGFPRTQILAFETFISDPEAALKTLNTFWGVSFESSQLNYQAGFHALIVHRAYLLTPQYVEKISDFHRGILDASPRSKQQNANPLSEKHQGIILKQTNETRKKLGYTAPSTAIKLTLWDTTSWTFYHMLALLFRPYLWRIYRLLPLKLKRIIRRRKKEFAP
jgi:Sulfotransferase family